MVTSATTWYVYVLCDPTTAAVRYVGQSKVPSARLEAHTSPNAGALVREWIHGLGRPPFLQILSSFDSEAGARAHEAKTIRALLDKGAPLLNVRGRSFGKRAPRPKFTGFGARMVEACRRLNIAQYELAELSGVSQATISKIENGVSAAPTVDVAVSIARVLGVSVEWLVTGEERTSKGHAA